MEVGQGPNWGCIAKEKNQSCIRDTCVSILEHVYARVTLSEYISQTPEYYQEMTLFN
jgi:hypothetical protein